MMECTVFELAVAHVGPNDFLVLKFGDKQPPEFFQHLRSHLAAEFPGVRFLILGPGVDISQVKATPNSEILEIQEAFDEGFEGPERVEFGAKRA